MSYALVGGEGVVPPTTMTGSKRGFAVAVLHAAGLRPGQGAQHLAIVEAGPWASVHAALTRPGGTEAVAAALEGLKGADRKVWDRVRREGPGRSGPGQAAKVLFLQAREYKTKPVRWDKTTGFNPEFRTESARAATSHPGTQYSPRPVLARRVRALDAVRWPTTDVWSIDARRLDPETVLRKTGLRSGRGVVVYIDPPYAGRTQGYAATLSRAEVVALARRWAKIGATVIVSEGEPIRELGWSSIEVTKQYVGRHREFTADTREFLTIHRANDSARTTGLRS